MAILKKIYAILPGLVMTGCCENFMPDVETVAVLCVNSLVTAGEPITVEVTRTRLYNEKADYGAQTVTDADIRVYANGELTNAAYVANEGDLIRIEAESKVYGSADAEVRVPEVVQVKSLEWTPALTGYWKNEELSGRKYELVNFNLMAEIEIADQAQTTDYYHFSYDIFQGGFIDGGDGDLSASGPPSSPLSCGTFRYEAEPIFSEHIGVFESIMGGDADGFTFFTDRQFSGKTYTLHIQFTGCSWYINAEEYDESWLDCGFDFTISAVSESYYNWVNYLWQRDNGPLGDMGEVGLGESIGGYSNVSTKAGVVAGRSCRTYRINLKEFLLQTINNHSNEQD